MNWLQKQARWTEALQDAYAQLRIATSKLEEARRLIQIYDRQGQRDDDVISSVYEKYVGVMEALKWSHDVVGNNAPDYFHEEFGIIQTKARGLKEDMLFRGQRVAQ